MICVRKYIGKNLDLNPQFPLVVVPLQRTYIRIHIHLLIVGKKNLKFIHHRLISMKEKFYKTIIKILNMLYCIEYWAQKPFDEGAHIKLQLKKNQNSKFQ